LELRALPPLRHAPTILDQPRSSRRGVVFAVILVLWLGMVIARSNSKRPPIPAPTTPYRYNIDDRPLHTPAVPPAKPGRDDDHGGRQQRDR
jgi:hypothetical protein